MCRLGSNAGVYVFGILHKLDMELKRLLKKLLVFMGICGPTYRAGICCCRCCCCCCCCCPRSGSCTHSLVLDTCLLACVQKQTRRSLATDDLVAVHQIQSLQCNMLLLLLVVSER
jgi:hypothetical protein